MKGKNQNPMNGKNIHAERIKEFGTKKEKSLKDKILNFLITRLELDTPIHPSQMQRDLDFWIYVARFNKNRRVVYNQKSIVWKDYCFNKPRNLKTNPLSF